MLKRLSDMFAALIGLILAAPILAGIAIVVRCSSSGPVLFRQERVGRNGKVFLLYKFRTMIVGVDRLVSCDGSLVEYSDSSGLTGSLQRQKSANSVRCGNLQSTVSGAFDAGNTARVTSAGRILRKAKLDELPQLWNVMKGDMSLVGPRPEVRKWVEVYPERWALVLAVRPGITDPASIVYRNEEDLLSKSLDPERMYREEVLPRKLDLYEEYVRTRSYFGDLRLLMKTVWVVMFK